MIHGVIMAGGGGTRFWPRSRQHRPKQFLSLTGAQTLLQQTVARTEAQIAMDNLWVITGARHTAEVARQIPELDADKIVGEPCGRDTAACIGLGAALIARSDPEGIMVVMPADHVIEPAQEFRRALHVVCGVVQDHPKASVTVGIKPTFPATGYGYIQRGTELPSRQGMAIYKVRAFREKPAVEVAEQLVATGEYFWNAGVFAWRVDTILAELEGQRPRLYESVRLIADAWGTSEQDAVFAREYQQTEKISIDYAVMEHAREVIVVEAPFQWDDVGSWLAFERMHPQDADGNTVLATHCGLGTRNCIVVADADKLIATIGVDNLLIVQDGDAILVADRRNEAGLKQLVELLNKKGLEKFL